MDDRTTTRLIEILETHPDIFVPIRKLWLMLQGENLALDISFEDLDRVLRHNDQLEFTPGINHRERFEPEGDPEFAQKMEHQMETLGFYSGPRVKLASRPMTSDDVFGAMIRNLTRMNEALEGAWETRPDDDPELEDQLLEILAAGQKLEREIRELIDQQEKESGS